MTDRIGGRRHSVWLAITPVAAGVFGLTTNWALDNNPMAEAEKSASQPSTPPEVSAPTAAPAIQRQLAEATQQYQATRRALLEAQQRLRSGEERLADLRAQSRVVSSRPGSGTVAAPPPAAPPPAAPVAPPPAPAPPAPAPPPVDTSTGAS